MKVNFQLTDNNMNIMESKKSRLIVTQHDKEFFWKTYQKWFYQLSKTPVIVDAEFKRNNEPIFNYFLECPNFFNCDALRGDISEPSFDKGLLIMGGFGVGKTITMKVLEQCFLNFPEKRFKIYTANEIVAMYEACQNQKDKEDFMSKMMRGVICIDDLFTERLASNFGKIDLLKDILEGRYAKGKKTFITCNYAEGLEGNVTETLKVFGKRYGGRVYDRFFEMFNIVEFKGKSLRR